MGDGFYRSKDPTNSIKVLKGDVQWLFSVLTFYLVLQRVLLLFLRTFMMTIRWWWPGFLCSWRKPKRWQGSPWRPLMVEWCTEPAQRQTTSSSVSPPPHLMSRDATNNDQSSYVWPTDMVGLTSRNIWVTFEYDRKDHYIICSVLCLQKIKQEAKLSLG